MTVASGWPLRQVDDLHAPAAGAPGAASGSRRGFTAQLEYETDVPLYVTLGTRQLDAYAQALAHAWSLNGLRPGATVAIYDYGSSPLAYLACSSFTPYLRRGAADLTGCMPVCNDGVSQMSGRAVEIARFVRPGLWVVRADCLRPFADELRRQGLNLAPCAVSVLAADNERVLGRQELQAYERAFGVPVRRLLRVDAALLLAAECPACSLFHARSDLYEIETVVPLTLVPQERPPGMGWLAARCRFARPWGSVRYLSRLPATLHPSGCPLGPLDLRFEV